MNTSEQILVVILATALAVLLVLTIIAVTMVIRLVQSLRRIAESAEKLVHSAESVGDIIKNTTSSLGAVKLLRTVFDMVMQHKSGKGK